MAKSRPPKAVRSALSGSGPLRGPLYLICAGPHQADRMFAWKVFRTPRRLLLQLFFSGELRLCSFLSSPQALDQTDHLPREKHRQQGAAQPLQINIGSRQGQHHKVTDEVSPLDIPVSERGDAHRQSVVASRRAVLEEVGKDYCMYCDPDSPAEWDDLFSRLLNHPEEITAWRSRLREFQAPTWDHATDNMASALRQLRPFP